MSMVVTSIQFNHDPIVKRSSALNLRRDATGTLPLPEWQRGRSETAGDSVAAYAIHATGDGSDIRVVASFQRSKPELKTVEVRAVQAPRPEFPWWLAPLPAPPPAGSDSYSVYLYTWYYQLWLQWVAAGSNVLGEVKPRTVTFGRDGTARLESFALANVRLASRGVGAYEVAWLWQFRTGAGDPWIDIETTRHRIYALLDFPTAPWSQFPADAANISLPWADALEVACAWSFGALNRSDVARNITSALWGLGGTLFEYGCPIGAMETYANTLLGIFNCSAFLDRVRGGLGNGRYVNCTDCASMVSTLANLLGCDLWQARMGMYFPSFQTEPILAIGSDRWQSPCGLGLGFTYHEVAWEGSCSSLDPVWDACLLVDAQPFIFAPPIPVLPTGMLFGFPGQETYRDRLAATFLDQTICEPRPWERRRRLVV